MITFITLIVGPGYLELNKSFKAYKLKHVSHEKKVQYSLFSFEKLFVIMQNYGFNELIFFMP